VWHACERREKCKSFGGEDRIKETSEDIGLSIREMGDSIQLFHDRDWWRAVVSATMNILVLAPRSWLYLSSVYLFSVN
jgi:hypothetical protein